MTCFTYPKGEGYLVGNIMDNVRDVNYKEFALTFHMQSIEQTVKRLFPFLGNGAIAKFVISKIAHDFAIKTFDSIEKLPIPKAFDTILTCDLKKKEQVKLLKDCTIRPEQLGKIFLRSEELGYTFSNYIYEGAPKNFKKEDLPKFIHINDDGSVEYYGETTLSEGQMRMLVDQADRIIARVLRKDDKWICLYQTFSGLKGKEPGKYGSQSHLHFISDSFGYKLEDVYEMLENGRCPRSEVHIVLDK